MISIYLPRNLQEVPIGSRFLIIRCFQEEWGVSVKREPKIRAESERRSGAPPKSGRSEPALDNLPRRLRNGLSGRLFRF